MYSGKTNRQLQQNLGYALMSNFSIWVVSPSTWCSAVVSKRGC